ncbi:MAG: RNA polymerase sigma factor [Gammaproteobacteria bacterium]
MPDRNIHWLTHLVATADRPLRSLLGRHVRQQADVADLAQEVYLRLLRHPDPDSIENPQAYLFTVANNLARERALSARKRGIEITPDLAETEHWLAVVPRFDEEIDEQKRAASVSAVLAELPPKCRDAIILHYHDGLTYAEAGVRLGVSSHAIKKYVVSALVHFRMRLGATHGVDP